MRNLLTAFFCTLLLGFGLTADAQRLIVTDSGGVEREVKRLCVVDAVGTTRCLKRLFVVDSGGTSRLVYVAVSFFGGSMSAVDSDASAFSAYQVDSDGSEYENDNGSLAAFNQWLLSGSASDWEVRMTMDSGTTFTGTLNTWLNCGTDQSWSLTDTSVIGGPVTGTGTLEFGRAGDNTALGSVTVSISAELTSSS